jgi:cell division cycle 20-like protein 1, cofactor of APC complex
MSPISVVLRSKDNRVMVWNAESSSPLYKFSDHTAAVKTVTWSPTNMISWNQKEEQLIGISDSETPSQVKLLTLLALASKFTAYYSAIQSNSVKDLVSTHGYFQRGQHMEVP